jgi:hypothetical protein
VDGGQRLGIALTATVVEELFWTATSLYHARAGTNVIEGETRWQTCLWQNALN